MPLTFESLNCGTVAFGFYNIDTDGLLLDSTFFFCTDFCHAVQILASVPAAEPAATTLAGHVFPNSADIGDLMGAIHGVRYTGYLGAVYRLWPFPEDPRRFRQHLNGADNRSATLALLEALAGPLDIPVTREAGYHRFQIGPYQFSREGLLELLRYVVRGGYPTWEGYEEGRMPEAVRVLLPVIEQLQT